MAYKRDRRFGSFGMTYTTGPTMSVLPRTGQQTLDVIQSIDAPAPTTPSVASTALTLPPDVQAALTAAGAASGTQPSAPSQSAVTYVPPPGTPPPAAKSGTGMLLAGAGAGFLLGGPVGAAVGAAAGYFLGKK